MEVLTVNPANFNPVSLVRGWSTMIWTERYLPAGEFELRSPRIKETLSVVPEGALITLADSREVMTVEETFIETNDDDVEEVVVKGRTIEAPWLEGRHLGMGDYRTKWKAQTTYSAVEAAAAVYWDMLCNATNNSILRNPLAANSPSNRVDRVQVMVTSGPDVDNVEWWFENGQAYPIVIDILTRGGAGIRQSRPTAATYPAGTRPLVFNQNGTITDQATSYNSNFLRVDFYTGVDRSLGQTILPPVSFDWRNEDLDKPRYLWSNKNLRNVVEVTSPQARLTVYADPVAGPNLTGQQRRTMYVDAGESTSVPAGDFTSALQQLGQTELKKFNREAAMDTAIRGASKYVYGKDYFLGDYVSLTGKYGFNQKMQITEFIRSSNGTVENSHPTLTLPT